MSFKYTQCQYAIKGLINTFIATPMSQLPIQLFLNMLDNTTACWIHFYEFWLAIVTERDFETFENCR